MLLNITCYHNHSLHLKVMKVGFIFYGSIPTSVGLAPSFVTITSRVGSSPTLYDRSGRIELLRSRLMKRSPNCLKKKNDNIRIKGSAGKARLLIPNHEPKIYLIRRRMAKHLCDEVPK